MNEVIKKKMFRNDYHLAVLTLCVKGYRSVGRGSVRTDAHGQNLIPRRILTLIPSLQKDNFHDGANARDRPRQKTNIENLALGTPHRTLDTHKSEARWSPGLLY